MLNNILFNAIIILTIIHSSLFFIDISPYTVTRLMITTFSSFLLFYIIILNNFHSFFSNKKYILIFVLTFYSVLQGLFSKYIDIGFETYQQLFISLNYLIYMLLIFILINNRDIFNIKVKSFILLSIYTFSIIIFFIFINLFLNNINLIRSIEIIFDNKRFFNHIQTLFLPIFYYSLLINKKLYVKLFLLILIIFNFYLIFLTGARGTFLSLIIASFIIFLTSSKKIKIKISYFYLIILISYLIYFLSLYLNNEIVESTSRFNTILSSSRNYTFSKLFSCIIDYKYLFNAIGFSTQDIAIYGFLHPHNIILYVFLGTGTFGMIIFIYILIKLFKDIYIKYKLKYDSLFFKMFTFSFISIFIHSLVSGVYVSPLVSAYLFIYFIIYFKHYGIKNKKNYTLNRSLKIFISLLLVMMAIVNIYLMKVNLDYHIIYNNTDYKYHIPGIYMFNENIYNGSFFRN